MFDVVEQAAGSGDQDFDAGPDDGKLLLDVDTAEHAGRTKAGVPAVFLDCFLDLDREFAGRGQDQCADRVAGRGRAGIGVLLKALQNREAESGGLAGTGLGAAHDVQACQYNGDGLRLDGCGRCVVGFGNRP